MLRLTLLGATDLTGPDGARYWELLAKPKRLALLVYLALAHPRGFQRRDTLAALFWPELDQGAARRALRQGLYVIRHDLPDGLLIARGDEEIALDQGRLWCDAIEFDAALDRGDPAGALERYGGELLAGFHLPMTPDFERWVEDERARFKARAVLAATQAARECREPGAAAIWIRRGLGLAPDDESLLASLLMALEQDGNRAAALRAYDEFVQRLRTDLDVEPSRETQSLAAAIRARAGRPPPPADHTPAAPSSPEPSGPGAGSRRRSLVTGLALAAAGAGGVWFGILAFAAKGPAEPIRLAVLPFENSGAPPAEYFANGLTEEIAARLAYVSGLAVIAPTRAAGDTRSGRSPAAIGKALGADYVLDGTIQWDPNDPAGAVRVSPRLLRVADASYVWAEPRQTTLTNVFEMQADLAERVAGALEVRLARLERRLVGEVPTNNPEAHGYYQRARERFRQAGGRWEESRADLEAVRHWLERATEIDSTFALAWADLARVRLVLWRTFRHDTATFAAGRRAAARALAINPDLAEALVARALVVGEGYGRWDRAARLLEAAVRRQPSNVDAWGELAWVQVRRRRWRDALDAIDRAVALDPASPARLSDLALIADWSRHGDRAVAAYRRAIDLDPANPEVYFSLAVTLVNALGDSAGSAGVLDEADRRFGRLQLVRGTCLSCLFQFWWASRYVDLLDSLSLAGPNPPDSGDYYFAAGWAAKLRGDPDLARARWDSALSISVGRSRAWPDDPGLLLNAAFSEIIAGHRDEGFRDLTISGRLYRQRGGPLVPESDAAFWGFAHLYAGELEVAADSFAAAIRDPNERLLTPFALRYDPRLAPLRRLPRFRALFQ